MSRLSFKVESSRTGELYSLSAYQTKTGLRFSCTCAAGDNGSYCKHRVNLLMGDISGLKGRNVDDVEKLRVMFDGSPAIAIITDIAQLEGEAEALKAKLKTRKRDLAIALMG